MRSSSKISNIQHGPNAHRGRPRHQVAPSCSPEKRPGIEKRGSRSEEMEMTVGTFASMFSSLTTSKRVVCAVFDQDITLTANRFAALSHTEPDSGVKLGRGIQPMQSDFTFRPKKSSPTTDRIIPLSEAWKPSDTEAEGKVLAPKPVALPSTRKQTNSVLPPLIVAEPEAPVSEQDSGHIRVPAEAPLRSPSGPSPFLPQSPLHRSPPSIPTESSSPDSISVPSISSPQSPDSVPSVLHPFLPSPSPLTTDSPLRPRRILTPKKPKVRLPPLVYALPTPQTTPPDTFFPASDPLAHTVASAEGRSSAMAAEIAAVTSRENPKATPEHAELFAPKRSPISRVHSSRGSKQTSVDAASEDGSAEEWEWIL